MMAQMMTTLGLFWAVDPFGTALMLAALTAASVTLVAILAAMMY